MPGTIASLIIGAFGGLAWLVAILVAFQRVRLLTRGVRTVGIYTDVTHRTDVSADNSVRTTVAPVVQVRDVSTGETFALQSSFSSSSTRVAIGQTVPVRYMPDDHNIAEIDRFMAMWFFPLCSAGVGTVLLGSLYYLKFHGR